VFVSAILIFRRFLRTVRRAAAEPDFVPLAGAALGLIATGTLVYTIGGGWSIVDGFYFAVATLTTSSIADPSLTLDDPWLKLFTAFYVLLGIGILVGLVRRLGLALVVLRAEDRASRRDDGATS
jgi:hypothetical protein